MQLKTGEMWDYPADIYLCTTNGVLSGRDELIMGKGSALDMKRRYPDSPRLFGKKILDSATPGKVNLKYGFIYVTLDETQQIIGAFQTKYHFNSRSYADLIKLSTSMLKQFALFTSKEIVLPYPGIGLGGLKEEEVHDIIKELPDNVIVFKRS